MAMMSDAVYAAKSNQIYLNYRKAIQQAEELNRIARDLDNVSKNQMQECFNQISSNWEGENSRAYINKGRIVQNKVSSIAQELRAAASVVKSTANVIQNAELRNLEIARRRGF